jgi:hypothetical protein
MDFAYKTLDMPQQVHDLEWVTTADLAVEILRRCEIGVITIGKQKTDHKHSIEVFTKGAFAKKMVVLEQTRDLLTDVGADE